MTPNKRKISIPLFWRKEKQTKANLQVGHELRFFRAVALEPPPKPRIKLTWIKMADELYNMVNS